MKVTIVQGPFLPIPPVRGGAVEKLWFQLGRQFAGRGVQTTHISRKWRGLPQDEVAEGVRYLRIIGYDSTQIAVFDKFLDLIFSMRALFAIAPADIVVTNCFFLPIILANFARSKGAVYVSVHRYPKGQMYLYSRVNRLQCVSTAVANAIRRQTPSVDNLVKVIPNFVPSALTEEQAAGLWSRRLRTVLYVGRIHPEKGLDLLILAFFKLRHVLKSDWRLRIIGPADVDAGGGGRLYLNSLKRIEKECKVEIEWIAPIYEEGALNTEYQKASLFVYPSIAIGGEAFGLAPLEAMAQGCPVVTSNLECFTDFIRDGVSGLMFDLKSIDRTKALSDVLASALSSSDLLRRLSIAGTKVANRFTAEKIAAAFLEDFKTLGRTC